MREFSLFLLLAFLGLAAFVSANRHTFAQDKFNSSLRQIGGAPVVVPPCTTNPIVTNNADSGPGSLRQAVIDACDGSMITFAGTVVSPISLAGGEIQIVKNLTISGPGANVLTVKNTKGKGLNSRVFFTSATVALSGLTITGGDVIGFGSAGVGGGIFNSGTLSVTNSTISGNMVDADGGGIFNDRGTVNVTNSTISGNVAIGGNFAGIGGGIFNGGTLSVTNSTISGNQASGGGGGIYADGDVVNVTNSTISGNMAASGGGILRAVGAVNARNSIIAGNTAGASGPDFSGTLISQGYNLIGNTSFASIGGITTGNILNQNPLLGPLTDNGGPTQTHALLPGSPAINAGNNALALDPNNQPLTTDQRGPGFPRTLAGTVDIGAFEDSCNRDTTPPVIVCPGGITRFSDPGQSNAFINPGTPVATDNCAVHSVTAVRSDGKALNAPYPFGVVTSIIWTARDTSGNTATCAQSIAVMVPSGQRRKP